MSQKSWNKQVSSYGSAYPENTSYDDHVPARLVEWPEGAPDRSEVPHAGDKMVTKDGTPYTVQSGIPYQYKDDGCYVRVFYYGHTHGGTTAKRLSDLVAWSPPPAPERTYTADQIEEAFNATAYSSAAALVKRMNV